MTISPRIFPALTHLLLIVCGVVRHNVVVNSHNSFLLDFRFGILSIAYFDFGARTWPFIYSAPLIDKLPLSLYIILSGKIKRYFNEFIFFLWKNL